MTRIAVTGFRGFPATWGGVEHHCENLYTRLAGRGYDITVYARSYYVPAEISSYKGVRIQRLPTLNLKYTDALFHTVLSLFHILWSKPDIVHVHGIGPAFFCWLPRLFRPGMKVFFTCHGIDWQRRKWPRWAARMIYLGELSAVRFAQFKIVVSRDLERYFETVHGAKTRYIPNGITPIERRAPERMKRWPVDAGRYFLCVARLVPEKRIEDVISAYRSSPRECKLLIVGDDAASGQYVATLREMAKNDPAVIFAGYQFGPVLEELYANARAYVTASELEGLPITLLEALSCGTISITSDIGPHRQLVASLPDLSFPVGNIAALAARMEQVERAGAEAFDDYSRQAVAMITREFDWDRVCSEHERLYRESMGER